MGRADLRPSFSLVAVLTLALGIAVNATVFSWIDSVLLLLIVCANVANLLLARAVSRQKEFGIRLALGARSSRLAQQLFTETLLLAGAGATTGILVVMWMGQSLMYLLPPNTRDLPLDFGGELNL